MIENHTLNLKMTPQMHHANLHEKLKTLVQQERELLAEILETIKSIDSQKLYLGMGYSSLFAYLVEGIGYSPSSAQRRIDAARLMKQIPSVVQKIESGELKLNQISLVQKEVREIEQRSHQKVSSEDKLEILEKIQGQSFQNSQIEVAKYFDIPVRQITSAKHQSDESVRIEVTLDKETYELFKQAQDLISNAVPSSEVSEFIKYVSKKIIQQKMGKAPPHPQTSSPAKTNKSPRSYAAAAVEFNKNNSIDPSKDHTQTNSPLRNKKEFSRSIKKVILQKQLCCQFKDPNSGKHCGSTRFLQVDHIRPKWADGSGIASNGQILCANHNKFKYSQEAGISTILKL